jgi:nitrogen fixation protein FixH
VGYVGSNVGNQIFASYHLFNDTQTSTIDVAAGKTLFVNYTSEVKQGKLMIRIFDSDDKLVAELAVNTSGTKPITAVNDEKYKLEITGDDTEGSFNVNWKAR